MDEQAALSLFCICIRDNSLFEVVANASDIVGVLPFECVTVDLEDVAHSDSNGTDEEDMGFGASLLVSSGDKIATSWDEVMV